MYLYVLRATSYGSSSNDNSVVNDFLLVQHAEKYTEEEFCKMASEYRYANFPWDERSIGQIAQLLEDEHGFILVPQFTV